MQIKQIMLQWKWIVNQLSAMNFNDIKKKENKQDADMLILIFWIRFHCVIF